MYDRTTATATWQPADRPGQVAALVALLFAPTVADDAEQDVAA